VAFLVGSFVDGDVVHSDSERGINGIRTLMADCPGNCKVWKNFWMLLLMNDCSGRRYSRILIVVHGRCLISISAKERPSQLDDVCSYKMRNILFTTHFCQKQRVSQTASKQP
jgi:hypothetical protein